VRPAQKEGIQGIVIPAKAVIQKFKELDARLRGHDE
jgi:hypothetical protein